MLQADTQKKERAVLVGIVQNKDERWHAEEYLEELSLLTDTAGGEVVEKLVQERPAIDPAYFIGRGKVQELRSIVRQEHADLIVFDDDLTPAQVRNLEKSCGKRVVDRSGLILDIFAKRAKTREAKTQVELAQLKYMLPRLTRQWTHLSRQEGGIGLRGPGETQLEVDRRAIRKRIGILTRELEKITSQRSIRRKHKEDVFKVALVGYTNAGKSTILNVLTEAEVFVENRLFATLDPTIRAMDSDNQRKILLIDTVGFIRKLPHHLVASFMSTLQESIEADMLLHVVDVSHPYFEDQMETVDAVLKSLSIHTRPTLIVFNKVDKLEQRTILRKLEQKHAPCVAISATRGIYTDKLKEKIIEYVNKDMIGFFVKINSSQTKLISQIHDLANVFSVEYLDGITNIKAESTFAKMQKIKQLAGAEILKFEKVVKNENAHN